MNLGPAMGAIQIMLGRPRGGAVNFSSLPQFPVRTDRGPSHRPWVWPSGRPMRRSLVASLTCLGLYAAVVGILRPWDPINPYQYYRIRLGMSEREVAAVI